MIKFFHTSSVIHLLVHDVMIRAHTIVKAKIIAILVGVVDNLSVSFARKLLLLEVNLHDALHQDETQAAEQRTMQIVLDIRKE